MLYTRNISLRAHSLPELAQRREEIAQPIVQLGNLRPGCVTGTSGRCGQPNCRCHQPGEPAHGPRFRLTYKVDGKTVIASRFKRSGMFWTVRGANTILALRCCHLNGRFEDYWDGRRDAIAA